MCGINGFNWADDELIRRMNDAVKHRGPDGEGVYVDDFVSLGHRRLSIIDLSKAGKQPMCNEDGSIWLVYNGEIYNFSDLRSRLQKEGHLFQSRTDSEVIIHTYEEFGVDCVKQFNGIWAFCLYDQTRNVLILSRDRFGVKPLYYYMDNDRIIFSSMIAGIMCHHIKTAPNDKAIIQYLAFNLEHHEDYTFFENIHSLTPGSLMTYDLKRRSHTINKWYVLSPRKANDHSIIRDAFEHSVTRQTVSDVPIGTCLSGGVDSSAIVCVLNRVLDQKFNTYSLVAPGSPLDETRYIKEVGKVTNTEQFFTTISAQVFIDEVQDFVVAQEEPVTGLSPYAQYRVMKLANEKGAKVLLDGQGGDEVFAGYDYYFAYYFHELLVKLKFHILLKEMALYVKNFHNIYPLAMFGFLLLRHRVKRIIWNRLLNQWIDHDLLCKVLDDKTDPRWEAMSLNDGLLLTLFYTAIPHLLRWEDKNSMRWGIESRVPFLDHELVEIAYSLPSNQKLCNGRTKVAFRRALDGTIPNVVRDRKDKIGFATTVDDLFRDDAVVTFLKQIVYSDSFKERPYWKWDKVEKLFSAHINGKRNAGDTIWKWVNLELWLRSFFEERSHWSQ